MMKSVLIVTNFNAGRKKAIKYKKKVIDFVLKYTKSFKLVDIDEFKTIDVNQYDTILAMGGDGTVNKVVPYLIGTDKVLGIIPSGTANLLAARLGISGQIDRALKVIEQNKTKEIDVFDINGAKCILRCGLGFDSDIICKTPQSLKNKFGYFAYFAAGIIFALRLKNKEYKMQIDGEEYNTNASCIIFANSSNMYKNFVHLGVNSKPDDGLMDVFVLKTENPVQLFFELLFAGFGLKLNSDIAEYIQAKEVSIENDWLACHIDGEKKNFKDDINIKIQTRAVKVFAK